MANTFMRACSISATSTSSQDEFQERPLTQWGGAGPADMHVGAHPGGGSENGVLFCYCLAQLACEAGPGAIQDRNE